MSRRHLRGASTTEFALGTLLLIPVLWYAISVGETFMAGAKAQEAEITAAFDVSAYRLHNYDYQLAAPARQSDVASLQAGTIEEVNQRVATSLRDLNSYYDDGPQTASWAGGEARLAPWTVGGDGMGCERVALTDDEQDRVLPFHALHFTVSNDRPDTARLYREGNAVLDTRAMLRCRAQVAYFPVRVPKIFQAQTKGDGKLFIKNGFDVSGDTAGFRWQGIGGSIDGRRLTNVSGSAESSGLPMLVDEWNVGKPVGAGKKVALEYGDARSPEFFAATEAVLNMHGYGMGKEQIEEGLTFLINDGTDRGQTDKLRLAISDNYGDEVFTGMGDLGNSDAYVFPRRDRQPNRPTLPTSDVVHSSRANHYLGHTNAGFVK